MKFYAIFIFILGIPMVFFVDTTIEFQICLIHAMNRRKAVHICVRRRFFFISEINYKRKNSSNFWWNPRLWFMAALANKQKKNHINHALCSLMKKKWLKNHLPLKRRFLEFSLFSSTIHDSYMRINIFFSTNGYSE